MPYDSGSTRVAVDYNFDMGRWVPYIGANLGYVYGDVNDTWIAGPEGGVKFCHVAQACRHVDQLAKRAVD